MNRDLRKVILIDWDKHAYQLQPRNALHGVKRWTGDEADTDLFYIASFLKSESPNLIFVRNHSNF
jgi:TFIIF-interacting CTD phosphatase-like protein